MCIHVSVLLCAHWAGWEEGVGWDEGLKNFNHVFHQQHWAQTYCCAGASVTKRSWRRLPANPLCPPGRAEMKIIHLTSGEQTFHFNSVFILYALKKKKNSFEPGEDASCDTEFLIFLKVFYFELPQICVENHVMGSTMHFQRHLLSCLLVFQRSLLFVKNL